MSEKRAWFIYGIENRDVVILMYLCTMAVFVFCDACESEKRGK